MTALKAVLKLSLVPSLEEAVIWSTYKQGLFKAFLTLDKWLSTSRSLYTRFQVLFHLTRMEPALNIAKFQIIMTMIVWERFFCSLNLNDNSDFLQKCEFGSKMVFLLKNYQKLKFKAFFIHVLT